MRTVTATDANRDFSKLLERIEKRESFTITKHGKAIAKIVPVVDDLEAREARKREHIAWLRAQPVIKATRGTRDELYNDD